MMSARLNRQRGVTLVELMVVIVILGLLSTIVVINVLPATDQAAVQKARSDISQLQAAIAQYRLDIQRLPTQEYGLRALEEMPQGLRRANRYRPGGYVAKVPLDPWDNPYIYIVPGEFGEYDILSYGRDGRPGGEGPDADIGSWDL
ncbi:MAG: type II secretion system major pseudopilin GspG [Pseudomonadota bacterium]